MPASDSERNISTSNTENINLTKDPQHSNDDQKLNQNVRQEWNIKASKISARTHNRIRGIVESLKIKPNPDKPMIPLSIGDPTTFGNLRASDETMLAVQRCIESGKYNGYAHSQGHEEARRAIAKYSAHQSAEEIKTENILMCSGCSAALEYCILALCDRGQNLLVPRPGFCLYQTLAEGLDIEIRYYDLLPERQWEADLRQLESLIDEKTAALLINNPSNPCGSVFSQKHLEGFLDICERNYLPIIADEIYEHLVFPGSKFLAISSLSKNVPILTCSGTTKRFLVPGWRMGWIIVHDRENRLAQAVIGLKNMCGRILGSNSIVQGALPAMLENTPKSFFDSVINIISANARLAYRILRKVRGLNPIMPDGAMYMMVGIDIEHFPAFKSDTQFVQELVNEQSVFCLPGACFECPNFMRIILTVPGDMMKEACMRTAEFCEAHYKSDEAIIEHGLLD
ncbi:tyrosine aminotransferase [Bactrocera oleae]|uniref:tyrosine aminotransferase n=1 Tax=Bactrocera oleae TaxID=104688 RepID=UPI00174C1DF0|nr:tyrosine aminotransferase-like isoform X1 [Bactrocera oleae]